MDPNERARRYRARKRGEDVPKLKPGPKPGFIQNPEHVTKRIRWGAEHHAWKGDAASIKTGRSRAARLYRSTNPCSECGAEKSERHHKDGNTLNNSSENIALLCRRCHMIADGRMDRVRAQAKRNQPNAVAARWR